LWFAPQLLQISAPFDQQVLNQSRSEAHNP